LKTGDEYFDSKEFQERLAIYEESVSSGQPVFMDAEELAEIADYYQMTYRKDKADEAIDFALSLAPGGIAPLTYKIHESLFNHQIDDAERYFSQITETDAPDYVYDQAEIMIAKGEIQEADTMLHDLLDKTPDEERQDFIFDIASIFQDYGIYDKAMEWIKMASREDTPEFKELMARTYFGLGHYKDSEKLFNELIDTNPFSKNYWKALANIQLMNENFSGAIQSSEYAIAIDPDDPDSLMAKANGLYELGNYQDALDYYERYVKLDDSDEVVLLRLGTCLINVERADQAIQVLDKALQKAAADSPTLVDIYQELAFAYGLKGDTDKAIACLDKTENLDCDHADMEVLKGHILLGNNRIMEAQEHFRKAIIDTQTPQQTFLRIIVSTYDNKYVQTAYQLFLRYFKEYGDETNEGYAYMALCCHDLKRDDEFLHYLKKACEVCPQECKSVLSSFFPEDMNPKDYYEYIKKQMNS